jgi:hypothetical protein
VLQRDTVEARFDQAIDGAVLTGVGILILVGFATSYRTLCDLAARVGGYPGWLAPAVPISFDLGIVVLSLKVAQAAREGRRAPMLRLLVALLSTATVLTNATAVRGAEGRLMHAVPPAMFVVCFENVVITMRGRALQARRGWPAPVPHPPFLRWVLAPRETWSIWRLSVLTVTEAPAAPFIVEGKAERLPALGVAGDKAKRRSNVSRGPHTGARQEMVIDLLRQAPGLPASEVRAALAHRGETVSLRTAQRLRARAAREVVDPRKPAGEARNALCSTP